MQVLEHWSNGKLIVKKFMDPYKVEDYIFKHKLTEYTLDGIHIAIIERKV